MNILHKFSKILCVFLKVIFNCAEGRSTDFVSGKDGERENSFFCLNYEMSKRKNVCK